MRHFRHDTVDNILEAYGSWNDFTKAYKSLRLQLPKSANPPQLDPFIGSPKEIHLPN
jgi:hypothetical protein